MTLIPYTISWDAPVNNGGSEIKKYQISLAIHDGDCSDWIDLNSTDTRIVALLPNDVEITIKIRTVNKFGPGEANIIQVRPVREPTPNDAKKQIGDKSVNIHLPDPPKAKVP